MDSDVNMLLVLNIYQHKVSENLSNHSVSSQNTVIHQNHVIVDELNLNFDETRYILFD